MIGLKLLFFITTTHIALVISKFQYVNLPEKHLKYYFNSFPTENQKCKNDPKCPYKVNIHRIFERSFFSYCK